MADDPESIVNVQFTIASGQSQSAAIDMDGFGILRIHTPATLTGTAMTLLGSPTLGGTYNPIYDDTAEYQIPNYAANRCIMLDPSKFLGLRFMKFRSGTAGAPTTEGADRVFTLECRSL
jgi:hypothetical protein